VNSALTIWVGARRASYNNTGRDTRCLAATSDVGKHAIDRNSGLGGDECIDGCLTTLKIKRCSLSAGEQQCHRESLEDGSEQHGFRERCKQS